MKSGPSVGKVPGDGATFFFAASDPAIARIGIAWAKRPKNTLLQYLPALALGPIAEHFLSAQGQTFW